MDKLLDRAAVVLTSAVFYLTAASAGLTAAAGEIATHMPEGYEDVGGWIVRGVAVLTAAVVIIRRVTPVPVGQRGVLPPT